MIVSSALYQVFYQKLRQLFIEREWNNEFIEKKAGRGELSPSVWNREDGRKRYVVHNLFAGARTDDHQYFHRRYTELKPQKRSEGYIDDLAFAKALRYIGMEVPPPLRKPYLALSEEVRILHDQFYIQFKTEIEAYGKTIGRLPIIIETDDDMENGFQESLVLVRKFYQSMNSGNLEECWNLLAPKFRNTKPWYGNYAEFERGFRNTQGIRNIYIFNPVRTGEGLVDCTVYYEDGIKRHIIDEISLIEAMTVKRIEEFVIAVKALKEKLGEIGVVDFDKLPLQKLFDPTVSEYICYQSQVSPEVFMESFPVQILMWVKRIYVCSCILIDGQWFIKDIIQEKTYKSR